MSSERDPHLDVLGSLASEILGSSAYEVAEVGNGNLNKVYRVRAAGSSVVVKIAVPYVRKAGPGWPLTTERLAAEARAYEVHRRVAPDVLPEVLVFDPIVPMLAMEDLDPAEDWRSSLLRGVRTAGVGERVGDYLGRVFVGTGTTFIGMPAAERIRRYCANDEMQRFTEAAMFFPADYAAGRAADPSGRQVDAAGLAATAAARTLFMERADCLIHGDLHSGSVMVRPDTSEVRIIDLEFAAYGPVSFDLGVFCSHLAIAHHRARVLADTAMCDYLDEQAADYWRQFWAVVDSRYRAGAARRGSLHRQLLDEARVFAAVETNRRVLGYFQVADTATLPPAERRTVEERLLETSRRLMTCPGPDDFDTLWCHLTTTRNESHAEDHQPARALR